LGSRNHSAIAIIQRLNRNSSYQPKVFFAGQVFPQPQ
jgi:hypothetical protein